MRRLGFSLGCALLLALLPRTSAAQTPAADGALSQPADSGPAGAKPHFEKALAHYRVGKYRLALAELEQAVSLDPEGKDLVYNLALVREKLGDYAGAIAELHRLAAMEHDPLEVARAEQAIARLEGARAEESALTAPYVNGSAPAPSLASAPCAPPAQRGRFDQWVLGAGVVSVAAALLGSVYGVRALTLDPSGETTRPGASFADLRARAVRAHHAALIADVSFGVSLAAGVTGATLYFGRSAQPSAAGARVSGAWLGWVF